MGTYRGTYNADTITPDFVSAGVGRDPVGSTPSPAADRIDGAGGNDIIDGGGGGDVIDGGDGSDTIYDSNAGNIIYGKGGDDEIKIQIFDTEGANPVDNVAYGDIGDDVIALQIGDWGDLLDDYWLGNPPSGRISLHGGAGNDILEVYSFIFPYGIAVDYFGGDGSDILRANSSYYDPDGSYGGAAEDHLYGGGGDDRYFVNEADDHVIEEVDQGLDTVIAYQTDFSLPANVENLQMDIGAYDPTGPYRGTGTEKDNLIRGGQSNYDTSYILDGLAGNDTIYGSSGGEDVISGGLGNDALYGKSADGYEWRSDADTIRGGSGNDLIYGGGGDTETWDGDDVLYGDDGNDRIFGSYGDDLMYGGTGVDELGGQAGNDTMYGGTGNDKLGGGTGNDALYGDADADVLAGREGLDRLTGGTGNDTFDYDAVTDSRPGAANRDVILDFVGVGAVAGDRIDLSTIDANTGAGGNQAFAFRGTASFTKAGQVRVLASGSDTLIQANTGGSLAPELEILVKDGTATPAKWVAGDFIL